MGGSKQKSSSDSQSEPVDPIQINPLGPLFAQLFGVPTYLDNERGGFLLGDKRGDWRGGDRSPTNTTSLYGGGGSSFQGVGGATGGNQSYGGFYQPPPDLSDWRSIRGKRQNFGQGYPGLGGQQGSPVNDLGVPLYAASGQPNYDQAGDYVGDWDEQDYAQGGQFYNPNSVFYTGPQAPDPGDTTLPGGDPGGGQSGGPQGYGYGPYGGQQGGFGGYGGYGMNAPGAFGFSGYGNQLPPPFEGDVPYNRARGSMANQIFFPSTFDTLADQLYPTAPTSYFEESALQGLGMGTSLFDNILMPSTALGALTGFRTDMDPIKQEAQRGFTEDFLPEAANQYAAANLGFSSDFGDSIAREAGRVSSELGAMQTGLDEASAQRRMDMQSIGGLLAQQRAQLPIDIGQSMLNFRMDRQARDLAERPGGQLMTMLSNLTTLIDPQAVPQGNISSSTADSKRSGGGILFG